MANDLFGGNREMQQYFSTLPSIVQETILQSGDDVTTISQLQNCAKNLTTNTYYKNFY
jgi:hypothetical protein